MYKEREERNGGKRKRIGNCWVPVTKTTAFRTHAQYSKLY